MTTETQRMLEIVAGQLDAALDEHGMNALAVLVQFRGNRPSAPSLG